MYMEQVENKEKRERKERGVVRTVKALRWHAMVIIPRVHSRAIKLHRESAILTTEKNRKGHLEPVLHFFCI